MRQALLYARRAAKKTQAQVAAEAGIERVSYVQIEGGRYCPSLRVAFRIARAVGGDIAVLFADASVDDGKANTSQRRGRKEPAAV